MAKPMPMNVYSSSKWWCSTRTANVFWWWQPTPSQRRWAWAFVRSMVRRAVAFYFGATPGKFVGWQVNTLTICANLAGEDDGGNVAMARE